MCTSFTAGKAATADGSLIVTRSADSAAIKAQHFVYHPARTGQTGTYSTKARGRQRLYISASGKLLSLHNHAVLEDTAPRSGGL